MEKYRLHKNYAIRTKTHDLFVVVVQSPPGGIRPTAKKIRMPVARIPNKQAAA